jgi:hypothetical protein
MGTAMTRDRLRVCWAYLVEIVLVGALYALTLALSAQQNITDFVRGTASSWTSTTEVLLGASFALLIMMVVNVLFTEFGDELRKRGAAHVYLWGFGTPALIFLLTTATLKLSAWLKDRRVAHAAFLFLLYSGINAVTLIKNTIELADLYLTFKRRTAVPSKKI